MTVHHKTKTMLKLSTLYTTCLYLPRCILRRTNMAWKGVLWNETSFSSFTISVWVPTCVLCYITSSRLQLTSNHATTHSIAPPNLPHHPHRRRRLGRQPPPPSQRRFTRLTACWSTLTWSWPHDGLTALNLWFTVVR